MALKRKPHVMSNKYNVKATIINLLDLAALRRPKGLPVSKSVAVVGSSRGGDGGARGTEAILVKKRCYDVL